MAGAVFLPHGSSKIPEWSKPASCNCCATKKRCASLHTTNGGSISNANPLMRETVSTNRLCPETRFKNCLGKSVRESGHNRVPAPPERIIGQIFMFLSLSLVENVSGYRLLNSCHYKIKSSFERLEESCKRTNNHYARDSS